MYCSKFKTGSACAGDTNLVNWKKYMEKIETPAPTLQYPNAVTVTWKEINWREFFTNSDEVTCPTLECGFTTKQTSNLVPYETEYAKVLEGNFVPYGMTNSHAGWSVERSIQCSTRDSYHDATVAPMTKDWTLTMKISTQRNCPRYLKPLPNPFTASVALSTGLYVAKRYPAASDPLFDPTFLPDPLNFLGLKYVNADSYLEVEVYKLYKEEIFTSDKQCILDRCIVHEGATCAKEHADGLVTASRSGNDPYKLKIKTSTDDGYDKEFCTRCSVRHMQMTSSVFRIVQRANCAVSLRDLPRAAINYHLYEQDTVSNTNGIIDWSVLFMNWDPIYCAVTKCVLYDLDENNRCTAQAKVPPPLGSTNLSLIEAYPDVKIQGRTDNEWGWEEQACLKCTNPLQTNEVKITVHQRLACKKSLGVVQASDVAIPFSTSTEQYVVGQGFTDHFTNQRPVDCGFSQCVLMFAGCQFPFSYPQYMTIETVSPWRVKMFQNIREGYEFHLCYKCTNGKQSVTQSWHLAQRYDCKLKMKAQMLMDSSAATQLEDGIYSYFVVAGSAPWYLNFEASFTTAYCPTTLAGIRIRIDGVDQSEHKFLNYTKNPDKDMAGRFDSETIGKFSTAQTYNMTVDLFDPNMPYLDVRAAVIKLNIVEKNKTNPIFIGPLNMKQTVEIGTDKELVLPSYVYFNTDAGDTVKMSLAFKSDNTEAAVILDQSAKKIKVSATEGTKLGVHTFKITLLEEKTNLNTVYDFEFTVLAAGT